MHANHTTTVTVPKPTRKVISLTCEEKEVRDGLHSHAEGSSDDPCAVRTMVQALRWEPSNHVGEENWGSVAIYSSILEKVDPEGDELWFD